MAQPSARPQSTVPGPADRESFFAAQRRHRRAARRYGALTTLGVPLVGIPLSALLTPPLLMVAFVVLHLTSRSRARRWLAGRPVDVYGSRSGAGE